MSQPARLVFVRHGETAWNQQHRWQGHADIPLSETGKRQAAAAARAVIAMKPDALYSSDLARALYCAELIAAQTGLPIVKTPELRERSVGQWEGLNEEEVTERFPVERLQHMAHPGTFRAPGGESREDVCSRVNTFLDEVLQDHSGQVVALITHAGPIKSAVVRALGAPVPAWRRMEVDLGSITILEGAPGHLRLLRLNYLPPL